MSTSYLPDIWCTTEHITSIRGVAVCSNEKNAWIAVILKHNLKIMLNVQALQNRHTLDTCINKHLANIKYNMDKPVANHFNQAGHCINNVWVKRLWPLFTDNARKRKDMESYLIGKPGNRKPRGINEKI